MTTEQKLYLIAALTGLAVLAWVSYCEVPW